MDKSHLAKNEAEFYIIKHRPKKDGDEYTFEFDSEDLRNAFEAGFNYASYGRIEVISRQQVSGKFRVTILDRE